MVALILALAVIALGGCGGDDDDGQGEVSVAELNSRLPTAGDLGLDERQNSDSWEDARGLLAKDLVIGGTTDAGELGTAINDAGFKRAVGSDFVDEDLNVRIRAIQFDSEEGALETRGLLHKEDLKSPCTAACVVTPIEYELDGIPDSAAVHHVPVRDLPPGQSKIEAHHAEFVIGPRLYVVQADGRPRSTFSADFDKLMLTVHESASSAG